MPLVFHLSTPSDIRRCEYCDDLFHMYQHCGANDAHWGERWCDACWELSDVLADIEAETASANTESDNDAEAAPANKVENFEAHCLGTLPRLPGDCLPGERCHAYANVATRGTCKFWKHRWEWSAEASCLNPVTQTSTTLNQQEFVQISTIESADIDARNAGRGGRGGSP